jgi:hypothetical protein
MNSGRKSTAALGKEGKMSVSSTRSKDRGVE